MEYVWLIIGGVLSVDLMVVVEILDWIKVYEVIVWK